MQRAVHRPAHVDELRDVVPDELEVERAQVLDVGHVTGDQVVDPDDGVPSREQGFTQM
ncbi:hypothetical protein D3C83_262670 [compost metagenome]